MRVFLDNKDFSNKYETNEPYKILKNIRADLDNKIIEKIILNDVEINEFYLRESKIEKDDIKEIRFITQAVDDLIIETLLEIESYLPRLKSGCSDTADFYRKSELEKASQKYELVLKGLSWYSESIFKITNLLDKNKFKQIVNDNLVYLNKQLEELKKAQSNNDNILIADILEYEIIDLIDNFIELNNNILKEIK